MQYVTVILERDTELVPGLTRSQLRAIAARDPRSHPDAPAFDLAQAEAGIARREARKAASRAA